MFGNYYFIHLVYAFEIDNEILYQKNKLSYLNSNNFRCYSLIDISLDKFPWNKELGKAWKPNKSAAWAKVKRTFKQSANLLQLLVNAYIPRRLISNFNKFHSLNFISSFCNIVLLFSNSLCVSQKNSNRKLKFCGFTIINSS